MFPCFSVSGIVSIPVFNLVLIYFIFLWFWLLVVFILTSVHKIISRLVPLVFQTSTQWVCPTRDIKLPAKLEVGDIYWYRVLGVPHYNDALLTHRHMVRIPSWGQTGAGCDEGHEKRHWCWAQRRPAHLGTHTKHTCWGLLSYLLLLIWMFTLFTRGNNSSWDGQATAADVTVHPAAVRWSVTGP